MAVKPQIVVQAVEESVLMLQFDTPAQAANWLGGRVTGTLRSDSRQVRAG
jgi:hypothetical protein